MSHPRRYEVNSLGETGTPVRQGFAYSSGDNDDFLSVDDLARLNEQAG
jgi:UDP-N-acetylglucosamine 4,6-dehydratase